MKLRDQVLCREAHSQSDCRIFWSLISPDGFDVETYFNEFLVKNWPKNGTVFVQLYIAQNWPIRFFDILHKVIKGIKGYKVSQTPYLRKFSFPRFRPKSSRPIRSLDFSNCYIFWTVQSFFIFVCIKIEYHETFKMMMSLFWKNACLPPKKGKMEQKWAEQLDNINFFVYCSKLTHLIFFDILHNVRGH